MLGCTLAYSPAYTLLPLETIAVYRYSFVQPPEGYTFEKCDA